MRSCSLPVCGSLGALLLCTGLLVGVAFSLATTEKKTAASQVELKVVKYPQLLEAINANKGKVVVLDVWGVFCLPCKKEFPHLVQLHERYAKDGLVCMSVSVDDVEQKADALKFLKSQNATFPNFLLDEDAEVWQSKFDMKGPPAVFIFNRAGERVGNFTNDDPDKQFTYNDVEKLAKRLLEQNK